MENIDWIVLGATLLFIVVYGIYVTRKKQNVEDFIRGGNTSKWWTVGLSVMATQASAITFLSTTGQGFYSGMGFVQFYFGLPIAMVIICLVFIPIYHRLKVYTAYEYLESRFDLKTRTLAAVLFLIQRSLAAGITIYAPAIILSAVLGWDLTILNIIIGVIVILYTVSGGTKAVSVTQKQQMFVIFLGMFIAFYSILNRLPENVNFTDALTIASANNKLNLLDFSFNLNNRYTVWSGLIGGSFLMLSYFGTDQSQVQRYLSGKNIKEMQWGLLFNGALKIPMQFFILLVGVMVYVFYQYNPTPLHFNPAAEKAVLVSEYKDAYTAIQKELRKVEKDKQFATTIFLNNYDLNNSLGIENQKSNFRILKTKDSILRINAKELISMANPKIETNDKDYVFIHFILKNLPNGLIGLLLAVIISAAMSSTASELNALASTTTMDLYKRNTKTNIEEGKLVKITKGFTLLWGGLAIIVACTANLFENLIQLVNIIGSIFYGTILGIFLLAFFSKKISGTAVFGAAISTQIGICITYYLIHTQVIHLPFLWLNLIGCLSVVCIANFTTVFLKKNT